MRNFREHNMTCAHDRSAVSTLFGNVVLYCASMEPPLGNHGRRQTALRRFDPGDAQCSNLYLNCRAARVRHSCGGQNLPPVLWTRTFLGRKGK